MDPFRPKDAPDPNYPLLKAARENDNLTDRADMDLEKVCTVLGLDLADVMYVAEQRAIRVALIITGRTDILDTMNDTSAQVAFRPTPEQDMLKNMLTPAILDAILLGFRGRGFYDQEEQAT